MLFLEFPSSFVGCISKLFISILLVRIYIHSSLATISRGFLFHVLQEARVKQKKKTRVRNDFRSEGAAPHEKWPKKEHKTISDEIKGFFFWVVCWLCYNIYGLPFPCHYHFILIFFPPAVFSLASFFSVDVNEIECVLGWFHRFNGDIAGLHFFIRPQ